jgi:hypothetical protein
MAVKVFEQIREHLDAPKIDFGCWPQKVFYPSVLQRQLDGWACGYFLLMAMRARAMKIGFEQVIDDAKEEMRGVVLEALLKLPCVKNFLPPKHKNLHKLVSVVRTRAPVDDADSDGEVIILESKTEPAVIEGADPLQPGADVEMADPRNDKTVDLVPSVAIDKPQPSGLVSLKQNKIREGKVTEISIRLVTFIDM